MSPIGLKGFRRVSQIKVVNILTNPTFENMQYRHEGPMIGSKVFS